jgi:flagellar hook-associated protein 1 FlgK
VGGIPVVQAEVGQQLLVVRQPDGSPALGREGLDGLVEPGGSIGGLLDRAWCLVSQTIGKLDTLALAIADGVNAVHADGRGLDGSTGLAFFAIGEGAHTLRLSPEIAGGDAGLRAIAAGLTSAPGDGDNARRLAGLKETLVVGGFPGWDGYWRHVIADLGVTGSEVNRAVQTGRLMVKELENRRDAVRGVSIDEEITNLVRYQHAYAAAARLATAADEMLETVVNRLGLVGR